MRAPFPATGPGARCRFSGGRLPSVSRSATRLLALCAALALFAPWACKKDAPTPAPAAELLPVPAPATLAADIFIPKPAQVYSSIRTKIGGALALLPATFPSAVVTLLGLSPQLLEQIDGNEPAFGVITDDGKRTAVALGVRVRDGSRTVSLMTAGADAKYTAAADPSGVTVLEPKPSLTTRAAALGVVGHYLVVAALRQDLVACAPYIGRTLPKRPAESGDVVLVAPGAALRGPIATRIRDAWRDFQSDKQKSAESMRKEKGKDADFAEPAAALAEVDARVIHLTEMLSSLSQARVQIDDVQTGIRARMTMTPDATGAASQEFAQLATGDAKPLLELPRGTVFGLLMRDNAALRAEGAKQQAASLAKLLGERMAAADVAKVQRVLETWAKGRGDWLTLGVQLTPDAQAAHVRGAVSDQKELDAALRQMLGLIEVPAFREPLSHHLGPIKIGKPVKKGETTVAHVVRDRQTKRKEADAKSEFDIAWRIPPQDEPFELFAVSDAQSVLETAERPASALRQRDDVTALVRELGSDVSFVLYFEPRQLVASIAIKHGEEQNLAAPVFLSYGGKKSEGWVRVDLAHDAARQLLRTLTQRR